MKNRTLILLGLAYLLVYLIFYPSIFLVNDEQMYSQQAQDMLHLRLRNSNLNDTGNFIVIDGKYSVSQYSPGNAIFLAPFLLFGFRFQFLTGPLLHMLTFLFVVLLMRRYKINDKYSLLYLFNPFTMIFSHYIFSDFLSMFLFTAGAYFFTKESFLKLRRKDIVASSIFFAALVLVRYQNVILLLPLFIYQSYIVLKNRSWRGFKTNRALFALPFLLVLCFILYYNNHIFGSIFKLGYSYIINPFDLNITHIFGRLFTYLIWFSLLLPLCAVALFYSFSGKNPNEMKQFKASIWLMMLFYSITIGPSLRFDFSGWVTGLRYMLVIFPMLLIVYSNELGYMKNKFKASEKIWNAVFIVLVLFFFIFGSLMSYTHYTNSKADFEMSRFMYSSTPANANIILADEGKNIFHSSFGERDIIMTDRIQSTDRYFNFTKVARRWEECYFVEAGTRKLAKAEDFRRQNGVELLGTKSINTGNFIYNKGDYSISVYKIGDCSKIVLP
jgi:hypothetical protein